MNTTTIDRRESYLARLGLVRKVDDDYDARYSIGKRLRAALNQRFRRQDAGERVCK